MEGCSLSQIVEQQPNTQCLNTQDLNV